MSAGVSGMRQRTSRPSARVSSSRTLWAASHSVRGSACATLRWWLRTTGLPAQRSMASSIMCQLYPFGVRQGSPPGSVPPVRLIQHKREAYWFYRFLSPLYDRWVNPLFWTPEMRTCALGVARLDDRGLRTVDVGAGTGFSTEGIVEHVDAANVTLL